MSATPKDAFFDQHMRLVEAAGRLYYAGVWTLVVSDLTEEQQRKLWEDLRDSLGLKPGAVSGGASNG